MFLLSRRTAGRCLKAGLASRTALERLASSQAAAYGEPGPSRSINPPLQRRSDFRPGTRRLELRPEPATLEEFNARLLYAAKNSRLPIVFNLARSFREKGLAPNIDTYHAMLTFFAENELGEEALALLSDMQACGVSPDVHTFQLVLQACQASPAAFAWARDLMTDLGLEPDDSKTYEIILEQWAERKNLEMCLQDLQVLFDKGIAPTLKTITRIVGVAGDQGQPRLAIDLINAYEAGENERVSQDAWLRVLMSSVEEHYDEGVELGLKACKDVVLHEGLIMDLLHYAARKNNIDIAQSMVKELHAQDIALGEQHYSPVISIHIARKEFVEALALFEVMHQKGIEPTRGCAEPLIDALNADWDNIDATYAILEAMRERGEKVSLHILNMFLAAANRRADLQRAIVYYRAFPSFGVAPDVYTMKHMLGNCTDNANDVLARELWDEMTAAGVEPDHGAYRKMIYLALGMPNYESSFRWLEEMKSKGIKPSASVYMMFVRRLTHLRDPRAKVALQEMEDQGYRIDGRQRRAVEHMGVFDETPPSEEEPVGRRTRRATDRMVHDKRREWAGRSQEQVPSAGDEGDDDELYDLPAEEERKPA